jgi:hypothetical protein
MRCKSFNNALATGFSYIIITGDLNADPSTINGEILKLFVENNNLTKHINEPTRITQQTRSELDQIITNCENIIGDIAVLPPVSHNDHHTVSGRIKFNIKRPKAYQRVMWQYELADFDGFRTKLGDIDWDECFVSNDIDKIAQTWTNTLISVAHDYIPNKVVTVRPWDKPFYNGYLRRLRRAKDRAHRRAKYDNTSEAWQIFRSHRNHYFSEIKRLKSETEIRLLVDLGESIMSNPRRWWSLSKKLLHNKTTSVPSLNVENNILSGDLEKAEAFNSYFVQCSTLDDSESVLPNEYPLLTPNTLDTLKTSVTDVRNCLSKLDPSKAFGPDGVSPRLLKEGAHQLSTSLCKLFNTSLQNGVFPSIWKRANVIPLHKKNDKSCITNYRPVSLLSSVGKTMERIVFKSLFEYFQANFLISVWQSGFIPGHSTVTHLVEIYHTFCQAISEGKEIRVVFCDVSRAFDRVWHQGLLFKLEKCGIAGTLLTWLRHYLHERYQRVVLNGQMSSWALVMAGVPQGSVLGTLLFLIYLNDITHVVKHCQIRMFADDTSLFIEVDDRVEAANKVNEDLTAISLWAKSWLVTFSPPKSESLIISNKTRIEEHPPIYMDGRVLTEVTHHKHVGVTISRDLSWNKHISSIENRARSVLNRMSQYKYTLTRRSLERIYFAYIRPIMEYADIVWAGGNVTDLDKLEMVQKDAARVVTGATARCSTSLLMDDTGWSTLSCRRRNHRLALFYQIVNGLSPPYLGDLLPDRVGDRTRYALRRSNDLTMPMCRTSTFAKSFLPNMVNEWNGLSLEEKSVSSLAIFKSLLRNITRHELYYYGPRHENIQLTRMRIKCSSLNAHLCFHLHVVDNAKCSCGYAEEDPNHFFFYCPQYVQQRQTLCQSLDLTTVTIQDILFGTNTLTLETNKKHLDAIYQYIRDTERFEQR